MGGILPPLGVATPWLLWLLPLALLPLLRSATRRTAISAVSAAPADPLSAALAAVLTGAGILALAGLIVALAGRGRLVIRPSGTEPVIRVMAEGEDPGEVEAAVARICAAVQTVAA